ncbi:MAG: methyltransferase domain-containing protein [Planctomycetes bacterium]|nr:methyltransferase domain-containing protein [Planctomycetota bacterium]
MRATVNQSTSARLRAAYILTECYDGEFRANDLLDQLQREHPLSATDAALTAELSLGVMRHRITCEHLAAHHYRGRWEGLRPSLRVILALGVYQLCWLDRIPTHAAVDETVKLAGRHGKGAASTTNAILRKIADTRGELIDRPNDADPCRYLPTEPHRGRLFAEAVFPDPSRRPLEHLIATTGHPAYLVERWHRRFKPKLARQICDAGARRPDLVLRANRMKTTPADLLARLVEAGHPASMIDGTDAIRITGHPAVTGIREFCDGLCQPQDSTAQLAVTLAAPQPGEFILDLCAGVGTKATQSAELMNNEGLVVAADIDTAKLKRADENARRLGLTIVRTVPVDGLSSAMDEISRRPDVILVDAPCSNTGVLARRPEARYRTSHKSIASLVALQREILAHAVAFASQTTRIVYSTCSLEEEENERLVEWFVSQNPTWRVKSQRLILPGLDRDGGFTAMVTQP